MTTSEATEKALQHAQRKYSVAAKKIVEASEQKLDVEKGQLISRGYMVSSAMWKLVGKSFSEQLEALLNARLNALLDAYQLYGVPLDEEVEKQVIHDLSGLRESESRNYNSFVSVQPWLGPAATVYTSGELSRVSDFLNEAKSAIEERRHKPGSSPRDANPRKAIAAPLVFVSCGQSTPGEKQLGKRIAELVEQETSCTAYFAENQTSFEGVAEHILKRLGDAVAFIAVMHPRGDVTNPKDRNQPVSVRGSVWVEQEIAIAAFITQAMNRQIEVRSYVHKTVGREGIRDKLLLNPVPFDHDSEIIDDLTAFLPTWRKLGQEGAKEPLSLKANVQHRRVAVPGGGDYERYQLLVGVENDGKQDATDFQLEVEVPATFLDGGVHRLQAESLRPGFVRFQITNKDEACRREHLYPSEKTKDDLISFHYAVSGKIKREFPEQLQEKVTATVFSGNMTPKKVVRTIAELMG